MRSDVTRGGLDCGRVGAGQCCYRELDLPELPRLQATGSSDNKGFEKQEDLLGTHRERAILPILPVGKVSQSTSKGQEQNLCGLEKKKYLKK